MSAAGPHAGPFARLARALDDLDARGLRRRRPSPRAEGRDALVLCANDYLGYAAEAARAPGDDEATRGARPRAPFGSGASRLVSGEHPAHRALERLVSSWVGLDDALVFSSGYAANVGLLSSLPGPDDVVVSDALNHASIIDGCRLGRPREVVVIPHNDVAATARALAAHQGRPGGRFVVTESYFSMDGDSPDLAALRAVCDEFGAALVVDEAHALGVFGPRGAGIAAERGVRVDALVGVFGKAIGAQGAFVAGPTTLTDWLWNRARSFVFSTGLSPALAVAAAENVRRAQADDAGRARLDRLARHLREGLDALGYRVDTAGRGPVVPLVIGRAEAARALSDALAAEGVEVACIRPPTVPEGTSRLRVTVNAGMSDADLARALDAFAALRPSEGTT